MSIAYIRCMVTSEQHDLQPAIDRLEAGARRADDLAAQFPADCELQGIGAAYRRSADRLRKLDDPDGWAADRLWHTLTAVERRSYLHATKGDLHAAQRYAAASAKLAATQARVQRSLREATA